MLFETYDCRSRHYISNVQITFKVNWLSLLTCHSWVLHVIAFSLPFELVITPHVPFLGFPSHGLVHLKESYGTLLLWCSLQFYHDTYLTTSFPGWILVYCTLCLLEIHPLCPYLHCLHLFCNEIWPRAVLTSTGGLWDPRERWILWPVWYHPGCNPEPPHARCAAGDENHLMQGALQELRSSTISCT
jgi:hypothetical protein